MLIAYDIIGVPIAAGALYPAFGILLSPIVAALAMSLSSVSVIANALRLRGARLEGDANSSHLRAMQAQQAATINRRPQMKLFLALSILTLLAAPSIAPADDMVMGKDGGPADKAYMAAMTTMMKDMAVKPTGDPDQDFVAMMLPHHAGAVDMAKVELQYGKDPTLRRLASDIVAAQEREIAMMRTWRSGHAK